MLQLKLIFVLLDFYSNDLHSISSQMGSIKYDTYFVTEINSIKYTKNYKTLVQLRFTLMTIISLDVK